MVDMTATRPAIPTESVTHRSGAPAEPARSWQNSRRVDVTGTEEIQLTVLGREANRTQTMPAGTTSTQQ